MIRTLATAALGWLGINTLGVLTLAAHSAWTSRRDVVCANRQRYTAEALAAAQQRHPAHGWLALHNSDPAIGLHPADCAGCLEAAYRAPAASVTR